MVYGAALRREKSGTIDHEALLQKCKEARLQAGLTKQPTGAVLPGLEGV